VRRGRHLQLEGVRYHVLATDYDGTLAEGGLVAPETIEALRRLRASGRRTVLVTGRSASDLARVFLGLEVFDRVVAENGATLLDPGRDRERALVGPAPGSLLRALAARGVPFDVGRAVVATREPHHLVALEVIRELGLELSVVFNKGAVMILPSGVTKATGLAAALRELDVTPHDVLAVGDAENDHALLASAELGASVANALPSLQQAADLVTRGAGGAGVRELVARLEEDDLASADAVRRDVPLGAEDGAPVGLRPGRDRVLIAGESGSGKSTAATTVIERWLGRGYQLCVIDPEGDHQDFPGLTAVGGPARAPAADEVLSLLTDPAVSVSVNLLAVKLADRPAWFAALLPRLQERRARTGRPHLWVADEAQHLFPRGWAGAPSAWPAEPGAVLLVTLSPEELAPVVLRSLTRVVVMGDAGGRALAAFLEDTGRTPVPATPLGEDEALTWCASRPDQARALRVDPPRAAHGRHRRRYAHGDVRDKAFRFRGPGGRLDLRAKNLDTFLQLAEGVDEDTWRYHLERGDVDGWLREAIKDPEAASEVEELRRRSLPADESRRRVREILEQRYMIE
jgi:hydroxymethylpyrimidine pyrophosphatase-like HAD family hydrolase